ncbi:DNA polymerase III subunit epsilon [Rhodoferax sp. PAMC 29310]|uniref:DNA polymerase III subunit epsilon n=1 Tax=Rhodoferax sp. PAMC 29310 TaxID=2822760 RepID=UPI001B320465|nr:DNA polymerase III subunit epsilon [Rhodoferax sp. PAMC 29310]
MVKRQIFIDTETTGLSASGGHRIVELAAVEAINRKLTGKSFHTYLNPGRAIDPYAQKVHGLSIEFLADKPRFADIAEGFMTFLQGSECLMHNAPFDTGFINAELEAAGYSDRLQQIADIVCTVNLAKSRYPGESASLDSLIQRSGNSTKRGHHSALEDAQLLADVYFRLFDNPTDESISPIRTRTPITKPFAGQTITPERLGMEKTIELTASRAETFFYRDMHKRIIDHRVVNEMRWKGVVGPLLYAVADHAGQVRYLGKWVTSTALNARWIRHKTIHHQESTRNIYLSELDAGRGPLAVWSISVDELKRKLPSNVSALHPKDIAVGLEALWIQRWKDQLKWNTRTEPVPMGFGDGDYWCN